jgi:hypothetical protein
VDAAWYRRIWQNFRVTDNLLVEASDFTEFSMVAPVDSRLPGGGGYTITGLYNINPNKFGQTQDYNTLSDKYGKQIEHWNGFDVTVNARLQNGLTLQAGTSTGRTTADNCEVVEKLPELLLSTANSSVFPATANNVWIPKQNCRQQEPWQTQLKAYGVYTIPVVELQVAGTYRNTPSSPITANFVASNAYLAANSTLGRPLAGNAANMTIDLLTPEESSNFLDRRHELDLRFGKVLRFGATRTTVNLDLYNALNSDALISVNQNYATWLRPTEILNARLLKISATFDF